jgi:L-ascorbate metabolism protein UlaG (beta-lactamase superfamily)
VSDESQPWPTGAGLLSELESTVTAEGSVALWHIGQSGFVLRAGQSTLLFDPFLRPSRRRLRRTWEPPFAAGAFRSADWVLCSHDHLDHLDVESLGPIAEASPQSQFVVPTVGVQKLRDAGIAAERIHVPPVDETVTLGPLRLHTVPAAHGDRADPIAECVWEADPERGYRFLGFILEIHGVTLYHAGDTIIYPGLVERLQPKRVDVAMLPINGRDWFRERQNIIGNLDHKEAADLGHAIGAGVIVPMHYDMFAGNPGYPGRFAEYCVQQYPGQSFHIPARARRWTYVK